MAPKYFAVSLASNDSLKSSCNPPRLPGYPGMESVMEYGNHQSPGCRLHLHLHQAPGPNREIQRGCTGPVFLCVYGTGGVELFVRTSDLNFEFKFVAGSWKLILSEIMREGTSRFVEITPGA